MSDATLVQADLLNWLRGDQWIAQSGYTPKAHAVIGDPPYFLGSITKRFGGKNAAVAQYGKDGAFQRQSRGFMGKTWDGFDDVWQYQAWVTEWATLLLDYVHPGAILALFGGTRTYHRLAAGLEDAGWEVFDCMMYVYGCVDEETEILTEHGWTHYHKDIVNSRMLCYNKDAQEFTWEHPSYVHHYEYDDTAYRIQSDSTDQLVSRNHRCLIERAGTLVFEFAEDAARQSEIRVPVLERMQSLSYTVPNIQSNASATKQALPELPRRKGNEARQAAERTQTNASDLPGMWQGILQADVLPEEFGTSLLQPRMQRQSARAGMGATRLQGIAEIDSREAQSVGASWGGESSMEGGRNLPQAARQLHRPVDQVCSLSSSVYQHGASRWLRHGASATGRTSTQPSAAAAGSGTSRRSRCDKQSVKQPRIVRLQPRSQAVRTSWISRTDLARITPTHYTGIMWCPTVPSGAFVARRNGHVFITGNSGFPKAADIGKLIDKAEGAEREIVGARISAYGTEPAGERGTRAGGDGGVGLWLGGDAKTISLTGLPITINAQRFDGYKTALKPAYEPIVLARAPRGKATYAQLAQCYGTGAINVDAGRIGAGDDYKDFGVRYGASSMQHMGGHQTCPYVQERIANGDPVNNSTANELGRYPANMIFDDMAAELLDQQSGERKAGGCLTGYEPSRRNQIYGSDSRRHEWQSYEDNGGASRFFYTAKAPTWEREAGLADFHPQTVTDGRDTPINNAFQRGETQRRNTHPTVKPIQLIEYLARLLLPPVLAVPRRILIPFAGVGSEMIGAQLAGWDEIVGIEREAEYCAINEARRSWWAQFKTYAQAEIAYRPLIEIEDDLSDLPLFQERNA